jgi:glycosyltransferase involved in cell wall biosynthesis
MSPALSCGLPPRVLITTDAVGGVWSYTLAIARGLADLDCRCAIAVLGPSPSPDQLAAADAILGVQLFDTGLPLDWTARDEPELARAAARLDCLAEEVGASTVHLHTPALAAFAWRSELVAVAHSCVGTWLDAVHPAQAVPEDFGWRMRLMRRGLERAAAVIAPSAAFAASLRRVYGFRGPIDVIHNGLPPRVPAPRLQRESRVLTAGRLWDDGKNVAVLDAAAVRLDAPIDAAGPVAGPDGSRFAARHLHLLGTLSSEALREACARSAIFAAPSLYEPFGLAVLEAAQLATPLVLADIPTFRELWQDAAVFVPAGDPVAWADSLRSLLETPARRDALGARAWARARLYDAAHMAAATACVLRAAHAGCRVAATG